VCFAGPKGSPWGEHKGAGEKSLLTEILMAKKFQQLSFIKYAKSVKTV